MVVGVGTFADKQIKPRPTADEDAKTIAGLLDRQGHRSLSRAITSSLLLSKEDEKTGAQEATKANILKALGEATKKVGKDDNLMIYMVMQGATAGEKPCLFATDSTFKDRRRRPFSAPIWKKLQGPEVRARGRVPRLQSEGLRIQRSGAGAQHDQFVRVFLGLKENDHDAEPPQDAWCSCPAPAFSRR